MMNGLVCRQEADHPNHELIEILRGEGLLFFLRQVETAR
jgi:hypothetical protein